MAAVRALRAGENSHPRGQDGSVKDVDSSGKALSTDWTCSYWLIRAGASGPAGPVLAGPIFCQKRGACPTRGRTYPRWLIVNRCSSDCDYGR